jgi:hypothetical protein
MPSLINESSSFHCDQCIGITHNQAGNSVCGGAQHDTAGSSPNTPLDMGSTWEAPSGFKLGTPCAAGEFIALIRALARKAAREDDTEERRKQVDS